MIKVWHFTVTFRLEEKEQGKITQTQSMLGVGIHSAKYLQNIEFSDRILAQDNKSELH
jgi:hypothetical protein